jgi:UDP-N-acetylmuramoylalanine--D-glutamate ligase
MESIKKTSANAENPLISARKQTLAFVSSTTFRMELVRTLNDIDFVNDAKSANTSMSMETIGQCKGNVVWITSDFQLMEDFINLKQVLKAKVSSIIYLSETVNESLQMSCKGLVENTIRLYSLNEALAAANSLATKGDTVLFSPASPGYQTLDTYQSRGNDFTNLVNNL